MHAPVPKPPPRRDGVPRSTASPVSEHLHHPATLVRRGFLGSLLERPGQPGRQLVSPLIGQAGVAGQIHEDDRRRSRWLGDRARPREASIASNPSTIPAKTVDDLQKYLDRAESLGGKTIVPPTDMGGVQFAHLADPQGTGFGLVPPPTT